MLATTHAKRLDALRVLVEDVDPDTMYSVRAGTLRALLAQLDGGKPQAKYLMVEDVARQFKVTPAAVRLWIKSGKLRATQPTGRRYVVTAEDLRAFVESGKTPREKGVRGVK